MCAILHLTSALLSCCVAEGLLVTATAIAF